MTEAMTLHEKALATRFLSIPFHLIKKMSSRSGIVVTPAGQTANGSCDRICRSQDVSDFRRREGRTGRRNTKGKNSSCK